MIFGDFRQGIDFLSQLDAYSFFFLFWFFFLFEFPRYVVSFAVITFTSLFKAENDASAADRRRHLPPASIGRPLLSVMLVGHNEGETLAACIASVREQTLAAEPGRMEIIVVDDGSSDDMTAKAEALKRGGQIDRVLRLDLRSGKHAASNLGLNYCRGDFVLVGDIDCSFDRDAFAEALRAFDSDLVGAVSGNLAVRNVRASMTTRFQAIEYLISISLGRRVSDAFGTLSIVSGAFGVFRRIAIEQVGGFDAEVGEDADLTLKLRRSGWHIRFAPRATALTDVPATIPALVNQRLRWDRGLVTLWGRKHRNLLNPFSQAFRLRNALSTVDMIFFDAVLTIVFAGYLVWLVTVTGQLAWVLLAATLIVYCGLAALSLLFAGLVTGRPGALRLLPYAPYYAFYNCYVMRFVRLWSMLSEWIFRVSYDDPYVPRHVMNRVERF